MGKLKGGPVLSGLIWTFAERISAQLVSLMVGIVLARILTPEHYGAISIVMVLITLCNIFVTSGLGTAIVQKREVDARDYNTAFLLSLAMSLLLYAVLFAGAPLFAAFYRMEELTPVIRVLGLRLVVTSVNTIQHAYIQRAMAFKRFFIATLLGTVVSGLVGVGMAMRGFGVWALVAQYLTNTTVDTVALFFVGGWVPQLQFSRGKAREICSFGMKVLCTQLVFTLGGDIRSLIIGKVFGSADLAFYDQGKKYPAFLVNNINSSIQKVLLPALSRRQSDLAAVKRTVRRCVGLGAYLLCPLLTGFAVIAKAFVLAVLTEKWLDAVPFIIIFCLAYMTRPLESTCHQALLALGKSGLVFRIMVLINTGSLIGVVIAAFLLRSVLWIALCSLITTVISLGCFFAAARHHFDYRLREQAQDLFLPVAMSAVMGGLVYIIGLLPLSPWTALILQVLCGAAIYLGLSLLWKPKPFMDIKRMLLRREA